MIKYSSWVGKYSTIEFTTQLHSLSSVFLHYISPYRQGHSKLFPTGLVRSGEHYVIKCMANDNLLNAHMAFLFLAVWCSISLSNLQITLVLCLLHNRLPCAVYFACVAADYFPPHHMPFYNYLLYHNVTSWTSPKITLVYFCLLLAFCKMKFCFYLGKYWVVQPKPDQPNHLLRPWGRAL